MKPTDEEIIQSLEQQYLDDKDNLAVKIAPSQIEKIKEEYDNTIAQMQGMYELILKVLKHYLDMDKRFYPIIALWIMGTYMHDTFETFPLLFFNATKGSGKTKTLKLVCKLSKNGEVLNEIRESVLFRTAKGKTLGIDEFEKATSKESSIIRTIMNAAYKKGQRVTRMRRATDTKGQEKWVEESFDLYTPLALANIGGIDEVLADRCISVILEKSSRGDVTRYMELFDQDSEITTLVTTLNSLVKCSLCNYITHKKVYEMWNAYIYTNYTNNINNTNYTNYTNNISRQDKEFFDKIIDANIDGRNLELFFPLFLISRYLRDNVLDELLQIAKDIVHEKREEDYTNSFDVALYDFLSKKPEWMINFISLKEMITEFKMFVDIEDQDNQLNTKWLGRALNRLKLKTNQRRLSRGTEVTINVPKAIEKLKKYKEVEKTPENGSNQATGGE